MNEWWNTWWWAVLVATLGFVGVVWSVFDIPKIPKPPWKQRPNNTSSHNAPAIELGSTTVNKPDFEGSFERVGSEISKLKDELHKINFAQPDLILGISGEDRVGGTILGAWLASPRILNQPRQFRQAFRNQKLSKETKAEIKTKKWQKFLLVDDESQRGRTIENEVKELKALVPNADIVVAVIAVRTESWATHYSKLWKNGPGSLCRCLCLYTNVPDGKTEGVPWHDIKWPWDAGKH